MLDKAAETRSREAMPAGPALDFQEHLARLDAQGLLVRIEEPLTKILNCTRWCAGNSAAGYERISAARSCSPM
jgi:hypothetical protein